MKDKSGGCYVPVSTAVSVLGVLGLEPAFLSEEPCMAVTCANPLLLVLNSYVCEALERNSREFPCHPGIEAPVQKQVGEQR